MLSLYYNLLLFHCQFVFVAGKWRIGEDLLPREMTVTLEPNGTEFFPTYCAGNGWMDGWIIVVILSHISLILHTGAFYVTNPLTSKALVEASKSTPFVWIDDAWVTNMQLDCNVSFVH